MRKAAMVLLTIWLALALETMATAQASNDVIGRVRRMVEEVQAASYPELPALPAPKDAKIEIKLFDSSSDYFQTRFTFTSFLFKKRLRYLLRVNRKLFADGVPEDGLRSILAHELGHVVYYRSRNRLALLGLVRLVCKGFTAHFERRTDLEAIQRGYGDGLKSYRLWLYRQISPGKIEEKKRNYFSPLEIDALQLRLRAQPELMRQWRKHPPRSLEEIEHSTSLPNHRSLPAASRDSSTWSGFHKSSPLLEQMAQAVDSDKISCICNRSPRIDLVAGSQPEQRRGKNELIIPDGSSKSRIGSNEQFLAGFQSPRISKRMPCPAAKLLIEEAQNQSANKRPATNRARLARWACLARDSWPGRLTCEGRLPARVYFLHKPSNEAVLFSS
jgi:hypothetical protein